MLALLREPGVIDDPPAASAEVHLRYAPPDRLDPAVADRTIWPWLRSGAELDVERWRATGPPARPDALRSCLTAEASTRRNGP